MMFRKNYVPNLTVYQDTDGKWVARGPTSDLFQSCFVQYEGGEYGVSRLVRPTRFDTIELLMQGIYEYACYEHIDAIKDKITYSSVKVPL